MNREDAADEDNVTRNLQIKPQVIFQRNIKILKRHIRLKISYKAAVRSSVLWGRKFPRYV